MLELLPEDAQPTCLSCLFLRLLPAEMKDQLATQDLLTLKAMAASTNRIFFNAWPRGFCEGFCHFCHRLVTFFCSCLEALPPDTKEGDNRPMVTPLCL
jgi:hypothetical protein